MVTTNPILKFLKPGDIVLIEVPSLERASYKQIIKITEYKFLLKDAQYNFDWADFGGTVLYTNFKMHKDMLERPIGNCMAITEKIPNDLLETIARTYDMWKADQYLMTDLELETKQKFLNL